MDKVIRVIQGANGVLTCGKKYSPNLTILDQQVGWRMREEKEKRGRKLRERSSTFSLGFPMRRLVVLDEARRKVLPCAKGFK